VLVHRDGQERIMCDWCYDVGPRPEDVEGSGWVEFPREYAAPAGGVVTITAHNCPTDAPLRRTKPVGVAPTGAVRAGTA
jgi:hypothetical protein